MSKWIYNNKEISSIEELPEDSYGFIYLITLSNNKKYIGKKNLYTERKRKFGKREIAKLEDKRQRKYEIVKKESDWKTYCGSKKYDDYQMFIDKGFYTKHILYTAKNKKHLTYLELKALIENNVLEDEAFLNDNILGKFFRKDIQ